MGFRWVKNGSPFACTDCTDADKVMRNCYNEKELSEDARIVGDDFDKHISEELVEKGAKKVGSCFGNLRLYECPLSFITSDTWDIIHLMFLIDNSKHLLNPGGWGNQPCWLTEAHNIYKEEYKWQPENS